MLESVARDVKADFEATEILVRSSVLGNPRYDANKELDRMRGMTQRLWSIRHFNKVEPLGRGKGSIDDLKRMYDAIKDSDFAKNLIKEAHALRQY